MAQVCIEAKHDQIGRKHQWENIASFFLFQWYLVTSLLGKSVRSNAHADCSSFFHPLPSHTRLAELVNSACVEPSLEEVERSNLKLLLERTDLK